MKKLLPLFLLTAASLPLFAQTDINGSLENYFLITGTDEVDVQNTTSLKLGLETVFDEESSLIMTASGKLSLPTADGDSPVTGNLSKAYYRYQSDALKIRVGRIPLRDSTGYILNLNLDGFELSYPVNDQMTLDLGAAYGGLTFDHGTPFVKILSESAEDELLGPSRLVWLARGIYKLESGLEAKVQGYGQFGMSEETKDLMTWYAGAETTLPLNDLIVQLNYTFNGGTTPIEYGGSTEAQTLMAHMIYGALRYYPSSLRDKGFQTVLSGLFTSGDPFSKRELNNPGSSSTSDPGGVSYLFTPISKSVIGTLMEAQPGNLIRGDLTLGFVPVKGSFDRNILEVKLGSAAYFRPANGPIASGGLDTTSSSSYLATEIRGSANLRPLSDLGLKWDISILLPGNDAFADNRESLEWASGLYLTLGF